MRQLRRLGRSRAGATGESAHARLARPAQNNPSGPATRTCSGTPNLSADQRAPAAVMPAAVLAVPVTGCQPSRLQMTVSAA